MHSNIYEMKICTIFFLCDRCVFDVLMHDNSNGGYTQKLLQLFNSPEILLFGRLYLVAQVLLNLDRFYSVLATIQYFRLWKSVIMDQFVTFRKRGP